MLPIKILHVVSVSDSLPFMIGNQIDYLEKKGGEFYIACSPSKSFIDFSSKKNATPFPVKITRSIDPIADIIAVIVLIRQIRKHKIDIVIGHTPKGSLVAMMASFILKVRLRIYIRHGVLYETSKGWIRTRLLRSIEQLTGFLATKVVCVSNSIRQISERDNLNSTKKNILLGHGSFNGIDATGKFNKFHIPGSEQEFLKRKFFIELGDFIFGFVGRLVNDKGVKELIGAWKIIQKTIVNVNLKLLIIGSFENRDSLATDLINFITNEPSIIYVNKTEDINKFYCLMDVFVFPSHREGLPTVVLEASAMELPIIATEVTGCIDSIIENKTGIFCHIDSKDIAEKMLFYFYNQELGKEHGRQGRKWVMDNFDQEKIWDEFWNKVLT